MFTRMREQKRRYRRFTQRKEAMPQPYRGAVAAVERYVWQFAGSQGDSLLPLMEDLADIFEQAAADGSSLASVVGDDPVEFAETMLDNYRGQMWLRKERERLAGAIAELQRSES